jgi:hypothetical protein
MRTYRFSFHGEDGRVTSYHRFIAKSIPDAVKIAYEYAATIHAHGVTRVDSRGFPLTMS